MRTEATWRCWLPIAALALPDAELPLAELPVGLPLAVEPVAPLPLVEPAPLGEPLAPVEPVALDDAEASDPVTST